MTTQHVHGFDRCLHTCNDDEVYWRCGYEPMFTSRFTGNTAEPDADDLADHDANEQAWARDPYVNVQAAEVDA